MDVAVNIDVDAHANANVDVDRRRDRICGCACGCGCGNGSRRPNVCAAVAEGVHKKIRERYMREFDMRVAKHEDMVYVVEAGNESSREC